MADGEDLQAGGGRARHFLPLPREIQRQHRLVAASLTSTLGTECIGTGDQVGDVGALQPAVEAVPVASGALRQFQPAGQGLAPGDAHQGRGQAPGAVEQIEVAVFQAAARTGIGAHTHPEPKAHGVPFMYIDAHGDATIACAVGIGADRGPGEIRAVAQSGLEIEQSGLCIGLTRTGGIETFDDMPRITREPLHL